jgi:hypothetical protein
MKLGRDLLLSAVDEQRPIVLLLGQNAWFDGSTSDPVLTRTLDHLGRPQDVPKGWYALLGGTPLSEPLYDWISERFERRVTPPWLEVLNQVPWSAIFTSALDPTLPRLFSGPGRSPDVILTAREVPGAVRSRARPPLYYLFGRSDVHDPGARPPTSRAELNVRRISHALPLLGRLMETSTSLGLVLVDGFSVGDEWLKIADILGALGTASSGQIIWFGGKPSSITSETSDEFDAAVASGQIIAQPERLGTFIAELRSLGQLPEPVLPDSEESGIITLRQGKRLETTPEERLRVEAVASIVDDSWISFLPPLGPDAEYAAFRRFHGDMGGTRLLVEGVRRGFAIHREFEEALLQKALTALADHASVDTPIILHGQSGTGKSVSLARLVAHIRENNAAPVLYAIGRVPQSQEVSGFCEAAERAGSEATLIVCDANHDVDAYRDLLLSLRSRGRRVVVIGSRYRIADSERRRKARWNVEAPTNLSSAERQLLADLVSRYVVESATPNFVDANILGFLYRLLPPSRPRFSAGLGAEARAAEHELRERGRQSRPILPTTQLAQKLVEAGFADGYEPLFNKKQSDVLESDDAAGRLIDLVMAAGSLNCAIPVNLLLRAVTEAIPGVSFILLSDLFGGLDLFRWKWADREHSELLVFPRLTLEADLICRRRLVTPEREADRLIELIRAVRSTSVELESERRFLFDLLHQLGADGPRGIRYRASYARVGRTLTEIRRRFGVVHAGLMLQESAFRRIAIREGMVDDDQRLPLLEEARDAIQVALDSIANGTITAAKRTKQNLQVERASLYGFLANDRVRSKASPEDIWSSYEAARAAIR